MRTESHTLVLFTHHSVGCRQWRPEQDGKMLDFHATTNHEDVCLSFLFTSHHLGDTLGGRVETLAYFDALIL